VAVFDKILYPNACSFQNLAYFCPRKREIALSFQHHAKTAQLVEHDLALFRVNGKDLGKE